MRNLIVAVLGLIVLILLAVKVYASIYLPPTYTFWHTRYYNARQIIVHEVDWQASYSGDSLPPPPEPGEVAREAAMSATDAISQGYAHFPDGADVPVPGAIVYQPLVSLE